MDKYDIDFNYIRLKAYGLLLSQPKENIKLPIEAENILIPGKSVIFDTIENYSKLTNQNIYEITAGSKVIDGINIEYSPGEYLVLHSEGASGKGRRNWTMAHEIGHILLEHKTDMPLSEIEANFFASCLLMPEALIKLLMEHGMRIFPEDISRNFGVSFEAAERKIKTLNNFKSMPETRLDKSLREAFYDEAVRILWDDLTIFIDIF
jgi:hypothetical protein